MAKTQIRIFLLKIYKKLKKTRFALNKKVRLKHAFVRALCFRGKKPQGLCTLRFVLKHAFNNTGLDA